MSKEKIGRIYRIAGPVVTATGISARMYDLVKVGNEKLMGEVIQIQGEKTTIQVYEDTSGLKPGEVVENTGEPLSVLLGPGLLDSIYDGIQRPLPVLTKQMGEYIKRGVEAPGLNLEKKWEFKPSVNKGESVKPGTIIGEVEEMPGLIHKIILPPLPEYTGKVAEIKAGKFNVEEPIGKLDNGAELKLSQKWPVRTPRKFTNKLQAEVPFITGQRIFDALFPLAKGGMAAIPGGFGTGKTVAQQTLAKWSDADIIVYIGCGERGNEMTEVLKEFPELKDPRTGRPLMNRTVLIANTSNMPVAAREASVYTGMTIAEYYRDMGYNVALMADSTSRWAEAMREISSRLEEMPGEEGYPAYLATRLAEFYERAGRVNTLSKEIGSITVIGAVSPPGGDFSEPVTQNTLRVIKTFWALDPRLAQRRHFPAINWLTSYSLYKDTLENWFVDNVGARWVEMVNELMAYLQEEEKLLEIVQLVGSDALPAKQQLTLEIARMIREFFLQQNAFHEVDTYCQMDKMYMLMETILHYANQANLALDQGAGIQSLINMESKETIANIKFIKDYKKELAKIKLDMDREFDKFR
ncbi:V-type ATP synthase subunit A [Candidatus Woesearchaeota archaeon]|nr:V-type ATP synthase subunit A [Candidatus Woesearchaeota archaeon]